MKSFLQFFKLPTYEDEDQARTAKLLYIILSSSFILNFINIFTLVIHVGQGDISANLFAAGGAIVLFALLLARRLYLVSSLFVVFTWMVISLAAYQYDGILNPIIGTYSVSILMAGLLIGRRSLIAMTCLCILTCAGLVLLSYTGQFVFAYGTVTSITTFSVYLTQFIFVSIMYYVESHERDKRRATLLQTMTDRKRSEALYRAIIDTQGELVCRFLPNGQLTFVNSTYLDFTGKSNDELMGTDYFELLHPDYRQTIRSGLNGLTRAMPTFMFDLQVLPKTGPPEWQRWSFAAIFDNGKGGLAEFQATGRDSQVRKLIEQNLRESEARYRGIVEDQTEYICRFTPDGNRVFVNQAYCRSVNRAKDDLLGRSIFDDLLPEDVPRIKEHLASLTPEKPSATIEHQTQLPDGGTVWQEWTDRGFFVNGMLVEVQSVGRDVSDRKQAEQIIFELAVEQAKAEFLKQVISEVSHDIRTPLTILGTSIYLLSKSDEPAKDTRYLAQLQGTTAQLKSLVDDLLSTAKLNDNSYHLKLESFNLSEILTLFEGELQYLLKEGQTVNVDVQPDMVITADKGMIVRALTNLLVNAINYTEPGGSIYLKAYIEAGEVRIQVKDTGIGIPAKDLAMVFERFYRSDNAKDLSSSGSGLGLYITKRVIETHKGTISVESQVGVGTTFQVAIPYDNG